MRILRAIWYLLRIRFTTSGWLITQQTPTGWGNFHWANGLIRNICADQYQSHQCPLEAIGVDWRTRTDTYYPIGAAADNRGHWLRPALLWATRLKETQP